MAYDILRTEVLLTGTPLEDKYVLNSLPLRKLKEAGFSKDDPDLDFINHSNGGMVLFQRRGEKISRALVLAKAETPFNEVYQSFLKILESMRK